MRKIPSIVLYFKLICLQIEGLIGHKEYIGITVALIIIFEVFVVVYFDVGE
jgi:hypothetical protein